MVQGGLSTEEVEGNKVIEKNTVLTKRYEPRRFW